MSRPELGQHGEQAGVIRTYEACGCRVARVPQSYRRGSRRSPGTPGMSDLYVFPPLRANVRPAPFWHEAKTEEGKLSAAQLAWRADCEARGVRCVVGGVPEAIAHLQEIGVTL